MENIDETAGKYSDEICDSVEKKRSRSPLKSYTKGANPAITLGGPTPDPEQMKREQDKIRNAIKELEAANR